jgi:acetolactate synthase small subunit
MSGPKISSYELMRQERERKRKEQIKEINERLNDINRVLDKYVKTYGAIANSVVKRVKKEINIIKSSLSGDLRVAFRNLRKLESFIKDEEKYLIEEKNYQDQLKQEQKRKERIIDKVISELEGLKEYKEILNDSILQRVESFKKAIKLNPDNENLLNQIDSFKAQVSKMYSEYLEKIENTRYVAKSFEEILGANANEGDDGFSISGAIDGVPIKVKLNTKDNQIYFDTPDDSSCIGVMDKIKQELQKRDINLGHIRVLKTGKVLNSNTNINKKRIKV